MRKKWLTILFLACVIVLGFSWYFIGSNTTRLNAIVQDVKGDKNMTTNKAAIHEIVKKYIPKTTKPIFKDNYLKYKGKWKGNVMPGLLQDMESQGWSCYDALGSKLFYMKVIDGVDVKISVLASEKGGPEEKDSITIVTFNLVVTN